MAERDIGKIYVPHFVLWPLKQVKKRNTLTNNIFSACNISTLAAPLVAKSWRFNLNDSRRGNVKFQKMILKSIVSFYCCYCVECTHIRLCDVKDNLNLSYCLSFDSHSPFWNNSTMEAYTAWQVQSSSFSCVVPVFYKIEKISFKRLKHFRAF